MSNPCHHEMGMRKLFVHDEIYAILVRWLVGRSVARLVIAKLHIISNWQYFRHIGILNYNVPTRLYIYTQLWTNSRIRTNFGNCFSPSKINDCTICNLGEIDGGAYANIFTTWGKYPITFSYSCLYRQFHIGLSTSSVGYYLCPGFVYSPPPLRTVSKAID